MSSHWLTLAAQSHLCPIILNPPISCSSRMCQASHPHLNAQFINYINGAEESMAIYPIHVPYTWTLSLGQSVGNIMCRTFVMAEFWSAHFFRWCLSQVGFNQQKKNTRRQSTLEHRTWSGPFLPDQVWCWLVMKHQSRLDVEEQIDVSYFNDWVSVTHHQILLLLCENNLNIELKVLL